MLRDNFCILILIAVIVFLLFMMNRSEVEEHFEGDATSNDPKGTLASLVEAKTNTTTSTNDQLIDTTATKVNKASISNVSANATTAQNDAVLKDILKEPEQKENTPSGLPVGVSALSSAAAFDNNADYDILNNVSKNNNALTSSDLLPGDDGENEFNQFNIPTDYTSADLLANGANKIGVNTVGSSRRFATHDIRGTVHCPKFSVSPWNNSTADPDTNIRSW